MAGEHDHDLLAGLPRTRPTRRSDKRPGRPAFGEPPAAQASDPQATEGREAVAAAVRMAVEVVEAGLDTGTRVLRGLAARLPRP